MKDPGLAGVDTLSRITNGGPEYGTGRPGGVLRDRELDGEGGSPGMKRSIGRWTLVGRRPPAVMGVGFAFGRAAPFSRGAIVDIRRRVTRREVSI